MRHLATTPELATALQALAVELLDRRAAHLAAHGLREHQPTPAEPAIVVYLGTGRRAKGILVVNAWRDLPLIERLEKDFPDQMIPYSRDRGHCLISGLQLFVILAGVESHPDRAEYWRNEILGTSDVIQNCDNWRSILRWQSRLIDEMLLP